MPIDYSSDIGKVRNLINDVDEANFIFTDERIQGFLDIVNGDTAEETIYGAAALALMALVTDESLQAESIRIYTFSINPKNIPASLLKLAEKYFEMAKSSVGAGLTINQLTYQEAALTDLIDNKIDFDEAINRLVDL